MCVGPNLPDPTAMAPSAGLKTSLRLTTSQDVKQYMAGDTDALGAFRLAQKIKAQQSAVNTAAVPPPPDAPGTFGLQVGPKPIGVPQLKLGS